MKGEYNKTLLRNAKEAKSIKRTNYWFWHRRGITGTNTYKYWSIPSLFIFLVMAVIVTLIVLHCETWIVDTYQAMLIR